METLLHTNRDQNCKTEQNKHCAKQKIKEGKHHAQTKGKRVDTDRPYLHFTYNFTVGGMSCSRKHSQIGGDLSPVKIQQIPKPKEPLYCVLIQGFALVA